MKNAILLAGMAVLVLSCTTLRPVEAPPAELAERILAGSLLKPGDRIRVIAKDGAETELRVAEIRADGTIVGEKGQVRADEIAALEKRERSWLKTGLLIGVVGLAILDSDCEGDPCGLGGGPFCCS